MRITFNRYNVFNNYNQQIKFTSNEYREEEMRMARALERKRREQQYELKKQREFDKYIEEFDPRLKSYPSLDDKISTKVAGFFSQFTTAIQNSSEHDLMEFFGDENTAAKLRENLSPECQADSKSLRREIQNLSEVKDPVMMLISANRLQKFAPKPGILNESQQKNFVKGIKSAISNVVRGADLDKFDSEDKATILEIVQQIEDSDSVKFGIEDKLKALVERLNKKLADLNVIPPTQVKNLDLGQAMKIIK